MRKVHFTKLEFLLIASVTVALGACSKDKAGGSGEAVGATSGAAAPAPAIPDHIVIELPENRQSVEVSEGQDSMFELGSSSGADVKGELNTKAGSEVIGRLNALSSKSSNLEGVRSSLNELSSQMFSKDTQRAQAVLSNAQQEAQSRKQKRVAEAAKKRGGSEAVQTLEILKNASDILIQKKITEANNLVAQINALDSEATTLMAAQRARDVEKQELEGQIKLLTQKIALVKEGQVATRDAMAQVRKTELIILDAKIATLEQQVKILEADFNNKFEQKRKEAKNWVIGSRRLLGSKTDADIRQEIINAEPELKITLEGAKRLRSSIEEVKNVRNEKAKAEIADPSSMLSSSQLEAELANVKKELAAYDRTKKTGFLWRNTEQLRYFKLNSSFISETDLLQKLGANTVARAEAIKALQNMDPAKLEAKDLGSNAKDQIARAGLRSAEFYRNIVVTAFEKELKDYAEWQKDLANIDQMQGVELSSASQSYNETHKALKNYHTKLSSGLMSLAQCHNLALGESSGSKRVLVDSIMADEAKNVVSTLATFEDFERTEGQDEYSNSVTVAYQNTADFKRFIYLLLNDRGEVVSFETQSELSPIEIDMKGTGTVAVEYNNPEDMEQPTFVQGDMNYKVHQFKAAFSTSASVIRGENFQVALCTERKDGGVELRTKKLVVKTVDRTPQSKVVKKKK